MQDSKNAKDSKYLPPPLPFKSHKAAAVVTACDHIMRDAANKVSRVGIFAKSQPTAANFSNTQNPL